MIRRMSLILTVLVLACACMFVQAHADTDLGGAPFNPVTPPGTSWVALPGKAANASGLTITQLTPDITIGSETVFSASATPSGDTPLEYEFYVCKDTGVSPVPTTYLQNWSTSDTINFTLYEPGDYILFAHVREQGNKNYISSYRYFSAADAEGVVTVSDKVNEIVAECQQAVSGEYETALWLHDWITHHAYYDYTYSNYDAEGILFYGKGVCDSYSKLYDRLLKRAGFECFRVTGGNHAWNAVKINGIWCQIDATWDDGGDEEVPVSGRENYYYFGHNDAMMKIDHTYECSTDFTSIENYYYLRTGEYTIWLSHVWNEIIESLQDGMSGFFVDTQHKSMATATSFYSGSYADKRNTLTAIILSEQMWDFKHNLSVGAAFTYDSASGYLYCAAELAPYTLALPSGLKDINASAFEGTGPVLCVTLPTGALSIGSRAFASCQSLISIRIPDSVTTIASDAFAGAPSDLVIICSDGSAAASYALANGYETQLP